MASEQTACVGHTVLLQDLKTVVAVVVSVDVAVVVAVEKSTTKTSAAIDRTSLTLILNFPLVTLRLMAFAAFMILVKFDNGCI